jgi:hypothetical protein
MSMLCLLQASSPRSSESDNVKCRLITSVARACFVFETSEVWCLLTGSMGSIVLSFVVRSVENEPVSTVFLKKLFDL